jgi:hypothetical protein
MDRDRITKKAVTELNSITASPSKGVNHILQPFQAGTACRRIVTIGFPHGLNDSRNLPDSASSQQNPIRRFLVPH